MRERHRFVVVLTGCCLYVPRPGMEPAPSPLGILGRRSNQPSHRLGRGSISVPVRGERVSGKVPGRTRFWLGFSAGSGWGGGVAGVRGGGTYIPLLRSFGVTAGAPSEGRAVTRRPGRTRAANPLNTRADVARSLARPPRAGLGLRAAHSPRTDLGVGREFRFSQKVNWDSVLFFLFLFLSPRMRKRMFCVLSAAQST